MKIKRYEPGVSFGANLCGTMEEDFEGEWVRLDDVMAWLDEYRIAAHDTADGDAMLARFNAIREPFEAFSKAVDE